MGKYIVLTIAIVLLYGLVRASLRRAAGRRNRKPPDARLAEDMVRCAQCGVHLPRGESLMVRGELFCSPEHQQQFSGQGKGR